VKTHLRVCRSKMLDDVVSQGPGCTGNKDSR
jgi:hypothetical protein